MNTLLQIYVVSEEPLSIEAPQARIEPCWRITRWGNSSTPPPPILQLLRQAHSELCRTNRHQQQDDVIEAVTAGCYNMLIFGSINGPIVFAIYKVWKCCSVSSCDYCSGTVSRRLLQFVSHWRTAVTCVCVCVCVCEAALVRLCVVFRCTDSLCSVPVPLAGLRRWVICQRCER